MFAPVNCSVEFGKATEACARMSNKHFFKPLLPSFHNHLMIPVAFFSKYIDGRYDQKKVAKLRSDVSKIIWEVRVEEGGQKLTNGWKEFALAHDLRVGDILIFKHESDMAFHVTLLGPSCCEIQYESILDDKDNNQDEKRLKNQRTPKWKASSSSSQNRFVTLSLTANKLKKYTMYLPLPFTMMHGINEETKMSLMDKSGNKWSTNLKSEKCERMRMVGGWKDFFKANCVKIGESVVFKLIWEGETSCVLKLCSNKR